MATRNRPCRPFFVLAHDVFVTSVQDSVTWGLPRAYYTILLLSYAFPVIQTDKESPLRKSSMVYWVTIKKYSTILEPAYHIYKLIDHFWRELQMRFVVLLRKGEIVCYQHKFMVRKGAFFKSHAVKPYNEKSCAARARMTQARIITRSFHLCFHNFCAS